MAQLIRSIRFKTRSPADTMMLNGVRIARAPGKLSGAERTMLDKLLRDLAERLIERRSLDAQEEVCR